MRRKIFDKVEAMTGALMPTCATSAPDGWLVCDGSAVSRTTYAALFAILGTTWGVGDGTTTFNIPDLRGRTIIGVGTGSGLTARAMAATVGAETHQLSTAEMPLHGHPFRTSTHTSSNASGGFTTSTTGTLANQPAFTGTPSNTLGEQIGGTGGGGSHNNMQPSHALNWIIAV